MPSSPPDACTPRPGPAHAGSLAEVLGAFTRLGLTAFGGPVAHLGYFRTEFVERRRWLDDGAYSELVALCQFLPGPASSQVGMALGLRRAGWWGALAAWAGFTLPSALLLIALAYAMGRWAALADSGAVHGLKVVAVAVVAQAVWGMALSLCPDRPRAAIAAASAGLVLLLPSALGQVLAIGGGALVGYVTLRPSPPAGRASPEPGPSRRTGAWLLALCGGLLLLLPALALWWPSPLLGASAAVYRAGALVFGGGHVVLPLLQAGVVPPGWVGNDAFLAGYGAAQAVPGPLFSFAAYLGAVMPPPWGGVGGGLALLVAIFLPAFLLVAGVLPFWQAWRERPGMQQALAGINAAVVGVLAAALYDPVWTGAIHAPAHLLLAVAAFAALVLARVSPALVVALAAATGVLLRF